MGIEERGSAPDQTPKGDALGEAVKLDDRFEEIFRTLRRGIEKLGHSKYVRQAAATRPDLDWGRIPTAAEIAEDFERSRVFFNILLTEAIKNRTSKNWKDLELDMDLSQMTKGTDPNRPPSPEQ